VLGIYGYEDEQIKLATHHDFPKKQATYENRCVHNAQPIRALDCQIRVQHRLRHRRAGGGHRRRASGVEDGRRQPADIRIDGTIAGSAGEGAVGARDVVRPCWCSGKTLSGLYCLSEGGDIKGRREQLGIDDRLSEWVGGRDSYCSA
jgi:hypothetical protein